MSEAFRTWRYHPTKAPEGEVFMSDDLPNGWYESPADFPKKTAKKKVKKKVAKKRVAKK